ncbi:MAG: RusA family crossover junction endodeoxyribonuclease [Chloroflexi bacterium]|nr:RusA family crossover junction endodeoxyribonuclease [Chloroflexota bacterium]
MPRLPVTFQVSGVPAPQGSKTGIVVGDRAVVVEGKGAGRDRFRQWRSDVRHACDAAIDTPIEGPVHVDINFYMPRPKSHYRTGRNAHLLRDQAPGWHTSKPDIDKLARAVLDAITGSAIHDDSQVARMRVGKQYADDRRVGATITVDQLTRK